MDCREDKTYEVKNQSRRFDCKSLPAVDGSIKKESKDKMINQSQEKNQLSVSSVKVLSTSQELQPSKPSKNLSLTAQTIESLNSSNQVEKHKKSVRDHWIKAQERVTLRKRQDAQQVEECKMKKITTQLLEKKKRDEELAANERRRAEIYALNAIMKEHFYRQIDENKGT